MIDIESFFEYLKAAWVPRLLNSNGKWKDYFIMLLSKIGFNIDYILKTSFRTNDSFPVLNNLSPFYQSILLAFNKAKAVVPFDRLSVHEILQLPLWGCEYFKIRNTCLYLDGWINNNMYLVKDLINVDGSIKNDVELLECTSKRITMIKDAFIVKNYVIKRIIQLDVTIGPFVNIRPLTHILYKKGYIELKICKSNIFYQMLVKKVRQRGNMESIYSNEFSFDNNFTIWNNIYDQKIEEIPIPKISEFNYKIMHNIVPCGMYLSKWKNISAKCDVCNEFETTKHMLYDCVRINSLWKIISNYFKIQIRWKHIVCGFPSYEKGATINAYNFMISVISYAIFKENSKCKFNNLDYNNVNISASVKENLIYYRYILEKLDHKLLKCVLFQTIIEHI